jgi:hypothetical protein
MRDLDLGQYNGSKNSDWVGVDRTRVAQNREYSSELKLPYTIIFSQIIDHYLLKEDGFICLRLINMNLTYIEFNGYPRCNIYT